MVEIVATETKRDIADAVTDAARRHQLRSSPSRPAVTASEAKPSGDRSVCWLEALLQRRIATYRSRIICADARSPRRSGRRSCGVAVRSDGTLQFCQIIWASADNDLPDWVYFISK
jgi:hypothetical protein